MAHGHEAAHRRLARAPFSWPDPKDILSALEDPFKPKEQQQQKTVTSVVYSTLKPTFSGPIGGYITPTADPSPSSTPKATPKDTPTTKAKTTQKSTADSSTSLPKSTASPTKSLDNSNSLLLAQQTKSSTSATSTASSDSLSQDSTATSGMTSGAKAGVAIAVIFGIGAVLLLAFFFVRQRKKAAERERIDDEKNHARYDPNPFSDPARAPSTRTARTASTAPRLSLRPVTEFLPNLGEKRSSRGNALQVASAGAAMNSNRAVSPPQNSWDRPVANNSQARENPFGNHAEAVDPVNAAGPTAVEDVSPSGQLMSGAAAGAAAGAVVGGAVVGLKRGASKRGNGPQPFDFTRNNPNLGGPSTASPTGTDYSVSEAPGTPMQTNGAVAIAAAGGPQNTSVHRVQLDFKPSMDDEIELRAGQLIRLLHEYDDGWALCIRLDRSQQGVAPRTCLSTRPVKPRPAPGPNGMPRGNPPPGMRVPGYVQQGRPQSPAGGPQGRPMTPNGGPQGRPMTPNGGPQGRSMTPTGRPMTPTGGPQGRSMSPGPRNSPSGQQRNERRITPPGPSRMNPSAAYASSPKDVPLPMDSPAQTSYSTSPKISPQNSISHTPVGRKPVPGQAM